VGALALTAGRFPLSVRYTTTGEMNAVPVMLAVQICAAALLHPWLFASRRSVPAIWALAMLMLQLAACLAGVSWQTMLWPAAYFSTWLGVLFLAACWYPGEKSARLGVALAGWLTIGGAVVWYLRAEFVHGGVINLAGAASRWLPVLGAISLSIPSSDHLLPWLSLAGPVIGVIGLALARLWRKIPA